MPVPIIGLIISAVSKVAPGLGSALTSIKGFAGQATDVFKKIFGGIKWYLTTISKLTIAFGTTVTAAMTYFIKGFMDAEKVSTKLYRAVDTIGKGMGYARDEIDEVTESLLKMSSLSEEDIKGILTALIRTEKLDPSKIKETAMQVIDLGTAIGDNALAIKIWERLLADPIDALTLIDKNVFRLTQDQEDEIAVMKKWGSEAEATAFIMKILNRETGAQATYLDTVSGRWDQMRARFDILRESIGKVLSDRFDLKNRFQGWADTPERITKSGALSKWFEKNFTFVGKFMDMMDAIFKKIEDPSVENEVAFVIKKREFLDSLKAAMSEFADIFSDIIEGYGWLWVQVGTYIGIGIVKGIFKSLAKMFDDFDPFRWIGLNSPSQVRDEIERDMGETPKEKQLRHRERNLRVDIGKEDVRTTGATWGEIFVPGAKDQRKNIKEKKDLRAFYIDRANQILQDQKDIDEEEALRAAERPQGLKSRKDIILERYQEHRLKDIIDKEKEADKNIKEYRKKNISVGQISAPLKESLASQIKPNTDITNALNTSLEEKTNDTDRIVEALAQVKDSVDNLTAV